MCLILQLQRTTAVQIRTRVIWVYQSRSVTTALLLTHQPQVRQPLRPLGQGSELLMYLFSLNDGLLNVLHAL